ncbi:transposase [Saprospira sp. CCB-QB6]|uniref:transposase n=1 Tax=Saprospira sp. CCB-QB6 TaxID=3023936 RepID=UPI00234AF023|nr:transposase [Saprospira sp. CCB-QB6]WCL81010.1 transposase [Saprospira sp. CCB-QB6]
MASKNLIAKPSKRGRPKTISDEFIRYLFRLKVLFSFGYRQLEGILKCVISEYNLDVKPISYSQICHRVKKLKLNLKPKKAENVFSVVFIDSLMSPPHSLEVFSNYYKTVFDDGFEVILDRGPRRKADYLSIVFEKIPDFQYQVLEDGSGWKAVFEHSSEFDYSPFAPATIK